MPIIIIPPNGKQMLYSTEMFMATCSYVGAMIVVLTVANEGISYILTLCVSVCITGTCALAQSAGSVNVTVPLLKSGFPNNKEVN